MNARTRLAAAIAITAAAATLATPGVASALTTTSTSAAATASVTGSSLVTPSRALGVLPSRGTAPVRAAAPLNAAAASGSCTEPNCNLTYHGGPVQHSPRVYLMFWGPKWNAVGIDKAAKKYLISFYSGLGKSPRDTWSLTTSQYADGSGRPSFGRPLLAGTHVDTATPPKSVTLDDLGAEAAKALSYFKIGDMQDAQVVIASQSATCFAAIPGGGPNFAGSCGKQNSSSPGYCAFHSAGTSANSSLSQPLPWVNLPFQTDAGALCGLGFVNHPGYFDGFSLAAGHETAETITDPFGTGWIDLSDSVSGGEIGDKCAWDGLIWGTKDPGGNLTLASGTFAMQSLWSNALHRCVMSGTLPLSVAAIPAQRSMIGNHVNLAVKAHVGGNTGLTYQAFGLPDGLAINRATGVISGTPQVTAGTFYPRVVVSYYAGSRMVRFTWRVSSARGQVHGFAGKCVDAFGGRSANGTKVDVWNCGPGSRQQIAFWASGALMVEGKCITGWASTVLEPCRAQTNQQWQRLGNGEYRLLSNGKCLTDPGNSKTNGTALKVYVCNDGLNQRWSLP